MTKTKAILGISFAAIFAISMTVGQAAFANNDAPGFLTIDSSTVTVSGDVMKASIHTNDKIPKLGQTGAFGYAFLTDGTSNVLALTSHGCASDSLEQKNARDKTCPNPVGISLLVEDFSKHDGANFHAHVLDLKEVDVDCSNIHPTSDLEVDFDSTVSTGNNVSPDWPVKVFGKNIVVGNIDTVNLNDSGVEAAVAFEILPIVSGNEITNLCLDVVGTGNGL